MSAATTSIEHLLAENERLRGRLDEAEATLAAIRNGEVDALVVAGPQGDQIFTLSGADRSYRILVEEMHQGAVTLDRDGIALFCNRRLAEILRIPQETLLGASLHAFVTSASRPLFEALLRQGRTERSQGEVTLRAGDDTRVPVYLAINPLPMAGAAAVCLAITDLTEQKLTSQMRNIAEVTISVANGDLSKKITVDVQGETLQLKDAINIMVDQLRSFASEVTRVAREVGTEGKLGGQAVVKDVAGVWKDLTDNVNFMAGNLTSQVRNIAEVATAIANGDLTQKITVDVQGEILELKNTLNSTVDRLNSFASEVTRVAREVGAEGKLGGQAEVQGVAGIWKDLTDSVNFMAGSLTGQVRNIAEVATAIAKGDLTRKISVDAKGEILELKNTINTMVDQLNSFTSEVTRVAREVGTEGKLGGQADVKGVGGVWKDLTDNVNGMAANLTGQVRAIADVATAVTKGDLTRSIGVEARGEVAKLKDNINQMIANLRDTTRKNTEQDWLKTNLAKFTRLLQGQREMVAVAKLILNELSPLVSAQHGVFYITEKEGETPVLKLLSSYAYNARRGLNNRFHLGEGLVGQCALEKERIVVTDVPRNYVRIGSGLGNGRPRNIVVIPINFEGEVKAVIELASFNAFTDIHLAFLDQLTEGIGIVLNTISAGMRTEELLKQSQSLAEELRSQQEELKEKNARLERQTATLRDSEELLKQQQDQLQGTNQELEEKARMLASQKSEVETKNHQIELARKALQEKAEQLALTSKYKSEFLANMSHELRTPLNSLLILSKLLGDNVARNLTPKQLEYAQTIHDSGAHLLSLINDILDMAKIESGTMAVDLEAVPLAQVRRELEHTFLQVAQQKELGFTVTIDPRLPQAIQTDAKRLQQVLNNLVSNACKFTEQGQVEVRIAPAPEGWSADHATLNRVTEVIAFAVRDTGIGIAPEKLRLVFEPFQQADMGTARKYGGTGLGLSISREIAHLLGGEIGLESTPGQGSTFTLYLPTSWPFHLPGLTATPARAGNGPAALVPATQAERASSRPRGVEPWAGKVDQLGPEVERSTALQEDQVRHMLVVEDNDIERLGITVLLGDGTVKTTAVATGAEALAILRAERVDVLVLDLRLPDISGFDVLREVAGQPDDRKLEVVIYTGIELTQGQVEMLRQLRGRLILKTPTSPTELLATVKACLKRVPLKSGSTPQPQPLARQADPEAVALAGRKILIVDDDYRNIFAVAALLEQESVEVLSAENGRDALRMLRHVPGIDLVLLDIMMPEMDGYEALRQIRGMSQFQSLPLIALTAKALKGDRERCLEAGASDYIAKPVDSDTLLPLIRRWLRPERPEPVTAAR